METNVVTEGRPAPTWTSAQAYILAVICLLLGAAAGFIVRGSGTVAQPQPAAATAAQAGPGALPAGMNEQQVTPEMMKHMAEKQARASCSKRRTRSASPAKRSGSTLTATSRPSRVSRAR